MLLASPQIFDSSARIGSPGGLSPRDKSDDLCAFARLHTRSKPMRSTVQRCVGAAYRLLGLWWQRMRQRCELSGMSEMEIHDAGMTSYEAWCESRKPFWRA
jgi:uncharacterized protein YjiS (DUF1127 family)